MTETEVQDFVTRFTAIWAKRDGEAQQALWHADGVLHYPMVNRPIAGSELARLVQIQTETAPDFVWQLLDWTARGDVIMVEWQVTRVLGGKRFDWRGVDKFRIRDGRIAEEWVYMDTALLRALRAGCDFDSLTAAARQGIAFEALYEMREL
jgi:ketosteroid isomerase-like protein